MSYESVKLAAGCSLPELQNLEAALDDPHAGGTGRIDVEVDWIAGGAWDRLVTMFDDALYDHVHAGAVASWGDGRLSHMVVRRDGVPIGAAQTVLLSPPGFRRGIAYVKFGPLWRRKGEPPRPGNIEAVLHALVDEYACKRRMHLTILPRPEAAPEIAAMMAAALEAAGFTNGRAMSDPNRYLVDLSLSREEQHRNLAQKWRYNLRKSERHQIEIDFEPRHKALAVFRSLYGDMHARKQFSDGSSFAVLSELFSGLEPALRPEIVIARAKGVPVAGAVVGRLGDTAGYLFGASNDTALKLNAGYGLQWWITGWLTETGARWYDLGGEVGHQGLRQFKKGMVGKGGGAVALSGEFDYCEDRASAVIANAIYRARNLQQFCRRLTGRIASANTR